MNAWDLNDLNNIRTAERRPLTKEEKLGLREARLLDREAGIANKERFLNERELQQSQEWETIAREQSKLKRCQNSIFLGGTFWAAVLIAFSILMIGAGNGTLRDSMGFNEANAVVRSR